MDQGRTSRGSGKPRPATSCRPSSERRPRRCNRRAHTGEEGRATTASSPTPTPRRVGSTLPANSPKQQSSVSPSASASASTRWLWSGRSRCRAETVSATRRLCPRARVSRRASHGSLAWASPRGCQRARNATYRLRRLGHAMPGLLTAGPPGLPSLAALVGVSRQRAATLRRTRARIRRARLRRVGHGRLAKTSDGRPPGAAATMRCVLAQERAALAGRAATCVLEQSNATGIDGGR